MDYVLDVRAVRKAYDDFAVDNVSFTLPPGYVMGLIGPNGAGKTTLIRLILGLARRDAGQVSVFGLDPATDGAAIRSRIGFVHESQVFYEHLTVEQMTRVYARFYAAWSDRRFEEIAAAFRLPLRKRVFALSRGTRTKLSLALALSHGAELLVLDEPTTGLDPVFRRSLLERLSALLQDGRTSVLFSTHVTSDLDRIADYVTFIRGGRLVFSDTRDEILDRWGVVKGGLDVIANPEARRFFRGIEETPVGFTGLTDDVVRARERFGAGVVIERPRFDDILVLTGKGLDGSGGQHAGTR